MQFWLSRHSEIPVREQLATQIVLGILSDDLKPGQRLPSTREMARRFHVHANTVSAAYRELERERWLELRHGSGVYVRSGKSHSQRSPALALDQLIASLFRSARELGLPLAAVRGRLRQWLTVQPPDHFLLIESDGELAQIVMAEMQKAVTLPITSRAMEECGEPEALVGAIPVVLPSKAEKARRALPPGIDLIPLRLRSVPNSMAPWLPARPDSLVAIASRWPKFLESARTMLVAADFHPDALLLLDACKPGWEARLNGTAAVVCDSFTATKVPKAYRPIAFPLLADSCLEELRRYQAFIKHPFAASV